MITPHHTFNALLATCGARVLLLGGGWAVLVVLAAAVESLSGGRFPATVWVGCPPALRRALLAGLGVALASGPLTPTVHARTGPPPGEAGGTGTPLPVPTRPLGGLAQPDIVVRPGDSLWRLAAARADASAPASQVARSVVRLHRANREVIGADPDLIRPGQRLVVPGQPSRDHHHEETR
jgi:nucleoid-associated protein YgaU